MAAQENFNINAIFLVAITITESGAGTAWSAIPNYTHNWTSFTGGASGAWTWVKEDGTEVKATHPRVKVNSVAGSSNTLTWCWYDSFGESIYDTAFKLSEDPNNSNTSYFHAGHYTVNEIGDIYCRGGDWSKSVNNYMDMIYDIYDNGGANLGDIDEETIEKIREKVWGEKHSNDEEWEEEEITEEKEEIEVAKSIKTIDSLDNFLFIGDSRYARMKTQIEGLGDNISVRAVSGSKPSDWLNIIEAGKGNMYLQGIGTRNVEEFPKDVEGISVMLGVNGVKFEEEQASMKTVLEKLHDRYPNTPIFFNSIFYVNRKYGSNFVGMNTSIYTFNENMKEYCDEHEWAFYIDITSGLYDESDALKLSYDAGDGLHLIEGGSERRKSSIKKY